jgi:hypothetical protein
LHPRRYVLSLKAASSMSTRLRPLCPGRELPALPESVTLVAATWRTWIDPEQA